MPADLSAPAYRLLMTTDTVGGVWRYCLESSAGLARAGVAVTLATLGPAASPAQRRETEAIEGLTLIDTGLPLEWLCERPDEVSRAAAAVAAMARDVGADLVQLNGTSLAGEAPFAVPVAAVHHSCLATWWASVKSGPLPDDWLWRRELVRRHLLAADAVAAPTRSFAEFTAKTYGLARSPATLRNGRSPASGRTADKPLDALFTAGRLWDEGKNIATLDRAAAELQAPVYAAGPVVGPNGARLACASLRLLGDLSEGEMRARLAARPLFVSTALYEPFGLAALEAAQAGCALILSDIPTFRELWDGAALFVAPTDAQALARAAATLLADSVLRESLASAARVRAKHYGAAEAAESLRSWHVEVLLGSRSQAQLESAA